jgi:hypothetical protein
MKHEKPALTTQLRRERESSDAEPALFLAVVHADDGVRFMTVASSRRDLVHRVAEYVRKWGGYLLRPDHARHLRSLLLRGESEAAVELYFALVGKRWDKEWLVTAVVSTDAPEQCAAVLGEIALQSPPSHVEQADIYYRQALTLADDLGMRPLQAHCHRGLGLLYAATAQREQARAERQRQAEESIYADPFVRELIENFGASVDPASIRPRNDKDSNVGQRDDSERNDSDTEKTR